MQRWDLQNNSTANYIAQFTLVYIYSISYPIETQTSVPCGSPKMQYFLFAAFCQYTTIAIVKYFTTANWQVAIRCSMWLSIKAAATGAVKFARHGSRQRMNYAPNRAEKLGRNVNVGCSDCQCQSACSALPLLAAAVISLLLRRSIVARHRVIHSLPMAYHRIVFSHQIPQQHAHSMMAEIILPASKNTLSNAPSQRVYLVSLAYVRNRQNRSIECSTLTKISGGQFYNSIIRSTVQIHCST